MKDMTSNIPPGFNEDGENIGLVGDAYCIVMCKLLNTVRSFPPVGGPEYSRKKELLDSLQEGVNKMNDKNDKV